MSSQTASATPDPLDHCVPSLTALDSETRDLIETALIWADAMHDLAAKT